MARVRGRRQKPRAGGARAGLGAEGACGASNTRGWCRTWSSRTPPPAPERPRHPIVPGDDVVVSWDGTETTPIFVSWDGRHLCVLITSLCPDYLVRAQVTFGKPAGNCFPLAGIVMTAAVAQCAPDAAPRGPPACRGASSKSRKFLLPSSS
jgi:hypothetical protein